MERTYKGGRGREGESRGRIIPAPLAPRDFTLGPWNNTSYDKYVVSLLVAAPQLVD